MAITYRTSSAGGATSGTGERTIAVTPAVNDLLVVFVKWSGNSDTAPTCTDNNGSGTYNLIGTALNNGSADNMAVFVRTALMANTTSTTISPTTTSGSNTAGEIVVVHLAGSARVGIDAVRLVSGTRQFGKQANQTTGVPTPALPAAALTTNLTIQAAGSTTTAGAVPNASWTERQDVSQSTPVTAIEVGTRDSGFTGTSAAFVSIASAVWSSMIIEFDGSTKQTKPNNLDSLILKTQIKPSNIDALILKTQTKPNNIDSLLLKTRGGVSVQDDLTATENSVGGGLWGGSGTNEAISQSFQLTAYANILSIDLLLDKIASPTDNIYIKVTSTLGGTPIATSNNVAASSVTVDPLFGLINFSFSNSFLLAPSTTYYIELYRDGARDTSNYIRWGADTSSPYTQGVAQHKNSGTWQSADSLDRIFRVIGINLLSFVDSLLLKTQTKNNNIDALIRKPPVYYISDGQTAGNSLTTTDSVRDPFNAVGSNAFVYDSSVLSGNGDRSIKVPAGTIDEVEWHGLYRVSGGTNTYCLRFYFKISALPSGTIDLVRYITVAGYGTIYNITSAGLLNRFNYTLSSNTWYRVEFTTRESSFGIGINQSLYLGHSTTALATSTSSVAPDPARGFAFARNNAGTDVYYDQIAYEVVANDTTFLGPAQKTINNNIDSLIKKTYIVSSNIDSNILKTQAKFNKIDVRLTKTHLLQDFEAGTNGIIATFANLGNDKFTSLTSNNIYDNTHIWRGNLSLTTTGGSPLLVGWKYAQLNFAGQADNTMVPQTWYARAYYYKESNWTSAQKLLNDGPGGAVRQNTDGTITLLNYNNVDQVTSSTVISTNQWWRFELQVIPSSAIGVADGYMELRIYSDPYSNNITETISFTGITWGTAVTSSATMSASFYGWLDDIVWSLDGWIGSSVKKITNNIDSYIVSRKTITNNIDSLIKKTFIVTNNIDSLVLKTQTKFNGLDVKIRKPPVYYISDGQTTGNSLTTTDSVRDPFDRIVGTTIVYDSTVLAGNGDRSIKLPSGGNDSADWHSLYTWGGSLVYAFRFYFMVDALPSSIFFNLISLIKSTTDTRGIFSINSAGLTGQFGYTISTGVWYRVEFTVDEANSSLPQGRLYIGHSISSVASFSGFDVSDNNYNGLGVHQNNVGTTINIDQIAYEQVATTSTFLGPAQKAINSSLDVDIFSASATHTIVNNIDGLIKKTTTISSNVEVDIDKAETSISYVDADLKKTLSAVSAGETLIKKTETSSSSVDFLITRTETSVNNIDASIKKAETSVSNVDSLLKKTETNVNNVDSLIKKTEISVNNVDSLLKKTLSVNWVEDALLKKTQTISSNADSLVLKTETNTNNVDASIKKTEISINNVDSLIKKTQITVSQVDSLLKKTQTSTSSLDTDLKKTLIVVLAEDSLIIKTESQSSNIDGLIKKTSTVAHNINSLILKTQTVFANIDVDIKKAEVSTSNVDSLIKKTQTVTQNVDSDLKKTFAINHNIDASILKTSTAASTVQSLILKTQISQSQIDSDIKKTQTVVHGLDTIIDIREASFSYVESLLRKTEISVSKLDSYIVDRFTITNNLDSLIKKTQISISQIDALVLKHQTQVSNIDCLLLRTEASVSNIDSLLKKTEISSNNIDSDIKKTEISISAIDSLILRTETSSQNIDVDIKKTEINISNINSLILRTETTTNNVDSLILKTEAVSNNVDANIRKSLTVISNVASLILKTQSANNNIDSLLRKTEISISAVDSLIEQTQRVSQNSDALIEKTQSIATFINAAIKKTQTSIQDIDVDLRKTLTVSYVLESSLNTSDAVFNTVSSLLKKTIAVVNTVDSYIVYRQAIATNADALIELTQAINNRTDSLIRRLESSVTNIDSDLRKTLISTQVVDSLIVKTQTITTTFESLIEKTQTVIQQIDSLILRRESSIFNIDSDLKKTLVSIHDIDSLIIKTFIVTNNIDALIVRTETIAENVDSLLRRTETTSSNIDTSLQSPFRATASVQALLVKTQTLASSVESEIIKTEVVINSIDVFLIKTEQSISAEDSLILKTQTVTSVVNTLLLKTQISTSAVDSDLRKILVISSSADSMIFAGSVAFSLINALIKKTQTRTQNIDCYIVIRTSVIYSVDSFIKQTKIVTSVVDCLIEKTRLVSSVVESDLKKTQISTNTIDSLIKKSFVAQSQIDALVQKTIFIVTNIDTDIKKSLSIAANVNAVIKLVSITQYGIGTNIFRVMRPSSHIQIVILRTSTKINNVVALLSTRTTINSSVDTNIKIIGTINQQIDALLLTRFIVNSAVESGISQGNSAKYYLRTTIARKPRRIEPERDTKRRKGIDPNQSTGRGGMEPEIGGSQGISF